MKSKKPKLLLALAIVCVLIYLLMHHRQSKTAVNRPQELPTVNKVAVDLANSSPPQSDSLSVMQKTDKQPEPAQQTTETNNRASLWRTQILYYGKVVDESNQPISGVQISFNTSSVNESLTAERYDAGNVTTDDRGIFKIDGVRGVGMVFHLSHPDYYLYPGNITDYDIRDYPKKGALPDTEQNAIVFRMHSKGHPVPLIFRNGGFHTPNNGTIADFPLRGNTRAEILGQLQIQGWSGIRSKTNAYDWEVQLSVPVGGIIETTNFFDFVAPETGYSESVDFEVAGSEMARKTYFLKLPSGYIRFKLEIIMGKDMFVSGNYYFNPDGSQNLEPGDVIHPTQ